MSAISASSSAIAMISKQDKKLYYADMDALESGEALQPFAPFSDLSVRNSPFPERFLSDSLTGSSFP
jgi:hypothetical protein